MNQLVKTNQYPDMKIYSFSSQYSNLDGDEKYNTKEIVSNDGKVGKVIENNNGNVKKYNINNLDNNLKMFNNKSYLTSIPIIPELFTPQLTNLPKIKHLKTNKKTLTTLNKILIVIILLLLIYIFKH